MKKLCVSLLLVMLLFGCKSTPQEPEPVETVVQEVVTRVPDPPPETTAATHYARGNELFNRNAFDPAIVEYNEAIRKDPAMAEARMARGNAYSAKLQHEEALKEYSAAAEMNPDYDHYARGYSLFLSRNYRPAIEEFSQAIDLKSNLLAAYNDRGLAYANIRNQDQAIADYNEALKINGNSAATYNNRGNAYLAKADYDMAIADYSRAIDLNPVLVYPYSGRGLANYRTKAYDDAIADFTKAIAIAPGDSTLYSYRRDAYLAKGEQELADADGAMAESLKK